MVKARMGNAGYRKIVDVNIKSCSNFEIVKEKVSSVLLHLILFLE